MSVTIFDPGSAPCKSRIHFYRSLTKVRENFILNTKYAVFLLVINPLEKDSLKITVHWLLPFQKMAITDQSVWTQKLVNMHG